MRCRHQNGYLIESMVATHVRDVVDGKMFPIGVNDIGNITGYEYRCEDCGKHWRYFATPDRPQWLRRIHEQLAIIPDRKVDWTEEG
jgi:hypothetical protein